VTALRRALQLKPDYPDAHNNLGNALRECGQLDEGVAAYRRALQLKPDLPETYNNLGNGLREQGQLDEASAAYRRALELRPDYTEAHINLGVALAEQGKIVQAIAMYRRALELKPGYAEVYTNLGNALRQQGQLSEALVAYRHALQLKPDLPETYNNLGVALAEQGQLDEAVDTYHRVLGFKPGYPETHINLGNALRDQGRLDEAVAAYRRALQLQPEHAPVHSNLVYTLHFHPGQDGRIIAGEHQRWNQQFAEPLKRFIQPHANDRRPGRRLRIGYVSPDFREHVVGMYLMPLFHCHDSGQFEILCYSGVVKPDHLTEEFRQRAHRWRSTLGVGDEALAEMIRQDGVDILVDLTLHMAGNRLPVFARRPAPVQVSFAGYPGSAGLETIRYRISDGYLEGDLQSNIEHQTSNIAAGQVCLIDSYWCYDPCGVEVKVNGLPAQESGRVTFGCLNNFCKINEPVLRLWASVLGRVKDSRLVLLSRVGSHRQQTLEVLVREGVQEHRVEFVDLLPRQAYLESYHRVDIALDPFPYNGHGTSLDALWMGVPVVSLAGGHPVARAGFSQLSNIGLPELVAFSEEEYVRVAVQLAHDIPRLAELRATLRSRMEASPVMDAPRFAGNIESAYRTMWQCWCAEQQP